MYKLLKKKEIDKLRIRKYKKKDIIFHENDECKYVSILISGEVIIKSNLVNGKEVIYNTIKDNMMFGHNLIFLENNRYLGDVISTQDSEVLFIDRDNLIQILKHNKEFLNEFLKLQAKTAYELNTKIKLLSFDLAYDRLMYYLEINNGVIKYDSITSLATNLFVQRETLSRLLTKLIKNKTITKKDKKIILNKH